MQNRTRYRGEIRCLPIGKPKVAGGGMGALNFEEGDLVTALSQIFVKLDH